MKTRFIHHFISTGEINGRKATENMKINVNTKMMMRQIWSCFLITWKETTLHTIFMNEHSFMILPEYSESTDNDNWKQN